LTALITVIINFFVYFTPGSLKTKVRNKAGMAIGPVNPWKTKAKAKAPN